MIAKSFKPVGWVAGIGAAALSCYMLSLQVASERAELASIERQIFSTRQHIRTLQTELGTRGRLQQLERWNAEVLALSAPTAGQFLDTEVRLASFDVRQRSFEDASGPVRMASVQTGPAVPAQDMVEPVLAKVEKRDGADSGARTLMRQASLVVAEKTPLDAEPAPVIRASSLLDETTLRALRTESSAEREGGAGN